MIKVLEDGKLEIKFSEYDALIREAEMVESAASYELDFITDYSPDSVYSERDYYPTVNELIANDVEHDLKTYLPFLVYYAEVYKCEDKEFKRARSFINELLREYLVFVD